MRIRIDGEWEGWFRYDRVFPDTQFTLTLRERGGVLSGTVREPRLATMNRFSGEIEAQIAGFRDHRKLSWRKTYHDDAYESVVHYVGELSEDGATIVGHWRTNRWTGDFSMTRLPRQAFAARARRRLFRTPRGG